LIIFSLITSVLLSTTPPPSMATEADGKEPIALRQITADAPHYDHYRALDPAKREIRVLDLRRGPECTLRHVSLDDDPKYHALSYYWGPPSSTRPLMIHQSAHNQTQVVQVRRTLAMFLEELYAYHGAITIWLDVICINQRSSTEQSSQVAMMGEIYRQAAGVTAWLGGWDPDIEYCFSYAKAKAAGDEINLYDIEKVKAGTELVAHRPFWTRYVETHCL
jgi:hypothetical protein